VALGSAVAWRAGRRDLRRVIPAHWHCSQAETCARVTPAGVRVCVARLCARAHDAAVCAPTRYAGVCASRPGVYARVSLARGTTRLARESLPAIYPPYAHQARCSLAAPPVNVLHEQHTRQAAPPQRKSSALANPSHTYP